MLFHSYLGEEEVAMKSRHDNEPTMAFNINLFPSNGRLAYQPAVSGSVDIKVILRGPSRGIVQLI